MSSVAEDLTGDELRQLQERVGLVEALVEEPGWAVLWDRALASMRARQARILGGYCADHEEYAKEIAFLQGIDSVRKLPEQMREELAQTLAEVEQAQADTEEELWQEA
jgi:hypothetical protein